MKKILSFKWEKLISIVAFIFFTYAIIEHQVTHGFNFTSMLFEMVLYYSMIMMSNYAIYTTRKDLLNIRR